MDDDDEQVLGELGEFRQQLLLMPAERVFTRRNVVIFVAVSVALQLAAVGGLIVIQVDTRSAVRHEAVLQDRIVELRQTVADQEATLGVAVEGILLLTDLLGATGEPVPRIVLLPPEDGGRVIVADAEPPEEGD